jgi:hypothetical protein
MDKLKFVVHGRENFTPEMIEKHETARKMTEEAVNSKELYDKIMAFTFDNTLGLTNQQIYSKIMDGAEDLNPVVDHQADIWVTAYYQNNRVVGYTTQLTNVTNVNTKFFNQYDYADISDNMFHEWLHKIGFDHSSAHDYISVPYALGYMVEDLVHDLMNGKKLTPMESDVETTATTVSSVPVEPAPAPAKKVLVCSRSWRTFFFKKCYYQ